MLPNFKPGQVVFARRTRNLSVNDVVVLKTHDNSQIIKRISKIQDRGYVKCTDIEGETSKPSE